jgi:hypothetical protein
MKSCRKNRKPIALLTINGLDWREAATLREHIEVCEGCRQYFHDVSGVAEAVAIAGPGAEIEPSEALHHRLERALRTHEPAWATEGAIPLPWRARCNWRTALAGLVAVLTLVTFAVREFAPHNRAPAATPPVAQRSTAVNPASDLAPTIANYERAARRSLHQFDELLTRQANQSLPPAPIYTASTPIADAE